MLKVPERFWLLQLTCLNDVKIEQPIGHCHESTMQTPDNTLRGVTPNLPFLSQPNLFQSEKENEFKLLRQMFITIIYNNSTL